MDLRKPRRKVGYPKKPTDHHQVESSKFGDEPTYHVVGYDICPYIIPWYPQLWSLLTILSPITPIMSIYGCRNIMLYPHQKSPIHPLYSWFTSHATPHPMAGGHWQSGHVIGRGEASVWEVFFGVKHGKTNHFKGKILGMIYIYKVGIDPSNVFLYIPSIFPLRYIFIVG